MAEPDPGTVFGDPGPPPASAPETVRAMTEAGLFDESFAQIDGAACA